MVTIFIYKSLICANVIPSTTQQPALNSPTVPEPMVVQASSSTNLAPTTPNTISAESPASSSRQSETTTEANIHQLRNNPFLANAFNVFMREMLATQNVIVSSAHQQLQNSTTAPQLPQTSNSTTATQPRGILENISNTTNHVRIQPAVQKKKVGRKALPRDANGKIIRPEPSELVPTSANKSRKTK